MAELFRDNELEELAKKMETTKAGEIRIVVFENGFITFATDRGGKIKTSDMIGAIEVVKSALVTNVINALVTVSSNLIGETDEKVSERTENSQVGSVSPNEQGSTS